MTKKALDILAAALIMTIVFIAVEVVLNAPIVPKKSHQVVTKEMRNEYFVWHIDEDKVVSDEALEAARGVSDEEVLEWWKEKHSISCSSNSANRGEM